MNLVTEQAKAEQHCFQPQMCLELTHNGDGATFAHENGFTAVGFLTRFLGGGHRWMVQISEAGRGTTAPMQLVGDGGRHNLRQIVFQECLNFCRGLVWHQTDGEFGVGMGGQNRFAARAGVAADNAVDI